MAERVERVLDIKVNYADAVKKIANYRLEIERVQQQQQALNRMYKEDKISADEYRKEVSALALEQKQYQEGIRVLNKEVSNEIKQRNENEGSIKALRAELSNLTQQYDALSRAEREGAEGKELKAHINEITTEIKGAEEGTQRYYRNVGNYPKEVVALFRETTLATGSLKEGLLAAGEGAKAMGAQLLKLLANPFVAAFAAITAVVMGVVDAFKRNEEQGQRLQAVFAAFTPVVNGIKNLFTEMAEVVLKTAEGMIWLADKIGLVGEKSKETIRIEQERLALTKAQREEGIKSAQTENEVAKLRDKVAQKDKYTSQERRAFLEKAIKLEEQQSKRRVEIAKRNLALLESEARLSANDAEMNNKLAQAKEAVIRADTEYYNSTRRLQGQLASFNSEEQSRAREQAKARADQAKQRREQEARDAKESADKEREAYRQAEIAMINLISDNHTKQREMAITQSQFEIEDLQRRLATEKNLTEKARADIQSLITSKKEQLNNTLAEIDKKNNEEEIKRQAEQIKHQQDLEKQSLDNRIASVGKGVEELNTLWGKALQDYIAKELQRNAESARLQEEKAKMDRDARLSAIDAEIADEEWKNEQKKLIEQKYENDITEIRAKASKDRKKIEDYDETLRSKRLGSAAKAFGQLADAFDEMGEHNKAFAKMSKVLALAEIAINTGKAIAAGVAQAQSVPFPANLAAIATTIATIVANTASAISTVKSAKFAKGGKVEYASGGNVVGKGSGTSDSISARLSNGESVNTALATSMFAPIYSALNQMGGGVPINAASTSESAIGEAMLARAVARGVQAMPNPVVSVAEINRVGTRVQVLENLATL